jgi:hypothetical protein
MDELFSQLKSPEHAFASDRPRARAAPNEADRFRALIEHLPVGVYSIGREFLPRPQPVEFS